MQIPLVFLRKPSLPSLKELRKIKINSFEPTICGAMLISKLSSLDRVFFVLTEFLSFYCYLIVFKVFFAHA